MKIAICVPHYGPVHAKFAQCLAKLTGRTSRDHEVEIFFREDGPLELKRTALVIQARGWGADYVQFIDTDQTFPADAILRLLLHKLPVVGCNIVSRHPPHLPTALMRQDERCYTTAEKVSGRIVEQVAAIGLGFALIDAAVFKATHGQLLFKSQIEPDGTFTCGEDIHFCNVVRTAGLSVWVDHPLSSVIGHIGERVFTHADAGGADAHADGGRLAARIG